MISNLKVGTNILFVNGSNSFEKKEDSMSIATHKTTQTSAFVISKNNGKFMAISEGPDHEKIIRELNKELANETYKSPWLIKHRVRSVIQHLSDKMDTVGNSVVVAYISDKKTVVEQVGSTRCTLAKNGRCVFATKDETYIDYWCDKPEHITYTANPNFIGQPYMLSKYSGILTNFLGKKNDRLRINTSVHDNSSYDTLLLTNRGIDNLLLGDTPIKILEAEEISDSETNEAKIIIDKSKGVRHSLSGKGNVYEGGFTDDDFRPTMIGVEEPKAVLVYRKK